MAMSRSEEKVAFCDDLLGELAYMIENIHELRDHAAKIYGVESEAFRVHDRHLRELADYMDWKLQILTTACPFEWKGVGDTVDRIVSVKTSERPVEEFSGGYLGG